jgi:uncharacterized protein YjdB
MPRYQVAYNATTKVATVQSYGDALPGSTVNIGSFYHDHASDDISPHDESHVFYHHVRDLLYKRKPDGTANGVFPNCINDMSVISIAIDATYVAVTAISAAPATVTLDLSLAETQQITNTFTPGSPSNTGVTYTTSDATKATVSVGGLITPVAVGSATITVTTADGGFTDTVVVTVIA